MIEIPLLGGQGHIFSLCVGILTRLGVTIFKMPPSTAATVNQFSNPKVTDVERGGRGEAEEGQGAHLLFLIRMDQSSSPFLSLLYLSISGTLFLFLSSLSSLYPSPSPSHFPSATFWVPSKGFQWLRGGLSLQNVIPVKQGPSRPSCFFTPPPVCRLVVWLRVCFWCFHIFDLQRKSTVVTSQICHFIKTEIINGGHKAGECHPLSPTQERLSRDTDDPLRVHLTAHQVQHIRYRSTDAPPPISFIFFIRNRISTVESSSLSFSVSSNAHLSLPPRPKTLYCRTPLVNRRAPSGSRFNNRSAVHPLCGWTAQRSSPAVSRADAKGQFLSFQVAAL